MSKKIAGIIIIQILLIVSSYLILVFFENQSTYLGNTINISGKNRFFGELLYQKTIRYVLTNDQNPPTDIIKNIDNNIKILSKGGIVAEQGSTTQNEIIIMAVPSKFSDDLSRLLNNWNMYKTSIVFKIYSTKDKNILNDQDFESQRSEFITSADRITTDLSDYSKDQVANMTMLQLVLLGINVIVHLLSLRIILRLIREDQTKKILLQQISDKNKELEFESKFALLQKDISQAFITDMEDKLHELNDHVRLMHENKDYNKNKHAINEIFQKLFISIQQLAQSKMELENKTSDYKQLIEKMRNNIFVISNGNNKLTKIKKHEDLATIMKSYIDIVNLMVYEQSVPSKLGKNLTDALYDMIDHLTLKTVKS